MALDLSALEPPFRTVAIPMSATPEEGLLVTLPSWARSFSMRPSGGIGKFSSEGADGVAIDSDHQTIADGVLVSVRLDRSGRAGVNKAAPTVILASDTASIDIHCLIELSAG